jgi:hypothetical protein
VEASETTTNGAVTAATTVVVAALTALPYPADRDRYQQALRDLARLGAR